jgi:hypothetical protein
MTSEELQTLLRVTLSSDKFGNLSPKQIAVVMMIADPEFRYNLKNEGNRKPCRCFQLVTSPIYETSRIAFSTI